MLRTTYNQFLAASRVATYVITSGDTLLFYQRFMEKAITHYFEGEPAVPLPVLSPSYVPDPAYPIYSEVCQVAEVSSQDSPMELSTSDECENLSSVTSESTQDVRHVPMPSHAASSLFAAIKDYETSGPGNPDIESSDTSPTPYPCEVLWRQFY